MSKRLSRLTLIVVTAAGLAVLDRHRRRRTRATTPSSSASDNAPGGAVTHVDDHRPAGAGQGRKVG